MTAATRSPQPSSTKCLSKMGFIVPLTKGDSREAAGGQGLSHFYHGLLAPGLGRDKNNRRCDTPLRAHLQTTLTPQGSRPGLHSAASLRLNAGSSRFFAVGLKTVARPARSF